MVSKELLAYFIEQGIHPAEVDSVHARVNTLYKNYTIRQGGKWREIEEPLEPLKKIQKALIPLFEQFKLHPAATAIKGGGTVPNVIPHEKANNILKVDVKSCYHAIKFRHVYGPFMDSPLMKEAIELCFIKDRIYPISQFGQPADPRKFFRQGFGHLPTGAPTSPILCNIALTELDEKVSKIAKLFGFAYTRYLDDLTLSTEGERHEDLKEMVVSLVESLIGPVNRRKSGWATKGKDKVLITGISLGNDGRIAPRELRRMLRARLQNIASTTREMDESTQGYLAYLQAIDKLAHMKMWVYFKKRLEYAPPK